MTSDPGDDPRTKFRQAFKLFGEAAGGILKQGIERTRQHAPATPTEDMRRAGAEVLRQHRVDTLIRDTPEPNRYLDAEAPPEARSVLIDRTLRDIATEVYLAMQAATSRTERPAAARAYTATEPPAKP
jgi:hypothetical protein